MRESSRRDDDFLFFLKTTIKNIKHMKKFTLLELVGAIGFTTLITMCAMGAWFIHLYNI